MESQIFLSAREAERAAYGPWGSAKAQTACKGCECVIMEDDKIRLDAQGDIVCARCGEDA